MGQWVLKETCLPCVLHHSKPGIWAQGVVVVVVTRIVKAGKTDCVMPVCANFTSVFLPDTAFKTPALYCLRHFRKHFILRTRFCQWSASDRLAGIWYYLMRANKLFNYGDYNDGMPSSEHLIWFSFRFPSNRSFKWFFHWASLKAT